MAYTVQQPGRPGEVAVVMRGKEGVGKGVLAKEFSRLLGSHYRHISQAGHLTGHFNAHLQQCTVLFADEAFFAGDRSHQSILKALITEDILMIEPKGVDPFPVRNCLHLMMSSNNAWVIPAGADARRYFVLTVSDSHKQDHPYFAAITKQMDDGGREALLHHLLSRDLSKFNVRNVPQTAALADQKARSRRGVDRLVETIAMNGVLPAADGAHLDVAITTGEDAGDGFYPKARTLVPELKYETSTVIFKILKQEWGCVPWKSGNRRGLRFPPLPELRELFDSAHGKQEWPAYPGDDCSSRLGAVVTILVIERKTPPNAPIAPRSPSYLGFRAPNLRETDARRAQSVPEQSGASPTWAPSKITAPNYFSSQSNGLGIVGVLGTLQTQKFSDWVLRGTETNQREPRERKDRCLMSLVAANQKWCRWRASSKSAPAMASGI
jgi:hypothetical protein